MHCFRARRTFKIADLDRVTRPVLNYLFIFRILLALEGYQYKLHHEQKLCLMCLCVLLMREKKAQNHERREAFRNIPGTCLAKMSRAHNKARRSSLLRAAGISIPKELVFFYHPNTGKINYFSSLFFCSTSSEKKNILMLWVNEVAEMCHRRM